MAALSRTVSIETVTLGSCTTTLRSVRGGPIPILFIHGLTATSFFFERLMQRLPERFSAFALDLRGHGDADSEDYEASTGMKTFSEDVKSLLEVIGVRQAHLVGWSLGGGVALQFAISYPTKVLSLTLETPISPFGFHATKDETGTPCWPDFAGSGAGTFFPELADNIRKGDSSSSSPFNLLKVWSRALFHPEFKLDRSLGQQFLTEGLKAKIGLGFIPGSIETSSNWPGYRPGITGILNAMSPAYCNLAAFSTILPRPPVLWIRGDSDITVGDKAKGTPASLGQLGLLRNWPGREVFPDQPMLQQTRWVLNRYRGNGGSYEEVVYEGCGHAPHIEKESRFIADIAAFIASAHPPSPSL